MNEDLLARLARLEFPASRLREGYDRAEVDAFLDEMVARAGLDG